MVTLFNMTLLRECGIANKIFVILYTSSCFMGWAEAVSPLGTATSSRSAVPAPRVRTGRGNRVLRENLPHCHCVLHKSHDHRAAPMSYDTASVSVFCFIVHACGTK
jgi:hypothetical protein